MVDYADMLEHVPELKRGDIVDISSDMLSFVKYCAKAKVQFDPNKLIDSVQKKVGPEGTILIRAWNWDFCNGKDFDIRKTPSAIGALGNVALARKDFKRTRHPIYSFAVWGKHRDYLCEIDNVSAWGKDSPFAFLTDKGGKQLVLGASIARSFTFVHFVEEQVGVSYRYIKDFTGGYLDAKGNRSVRTYQMYVRDLNYVMDISADKLVPCLIEQGLAHIQEFDGVTISVVELQGAYNVVARDILENNSESFCRITPVEGQKG